MEEKMKKVEAYFDANIRECNKKAAALNQQDCRDEANFEKVRANIYDIFQKMFRFSIRTSKVKDEKSIAVLFYQKLDQIPENWKISYQKAKEHDDAAKCYIEEIKLNVVKEIRNEFQQIWEETV